jgi:hypothetical protein
MFRRDRSLATHHISVPNNEPRIEEYSRIIKRVSFVGDKVGDRVFGERISKSEELPGIDCRGANCSLRC